MKNNIKISIIAVFALLIISGVYLLGRMSKDNTTDELLVSYNVSKTNIDMLCKAVGRESTIKNSLSKKLHEKIPEFAESNKTVLCTEYGSAPSEKTESGSIAE